MKQRFTFLLSLAIWAFPLLLLGQIQTISFTTINVSCFGESNGCATAVLNGSSAGRLGYLWSTGETTSTICQLQQGAYYVTVTDTTTILGGVAVTRVYEEDFDGGHRWSLASITGTNSAEPNIWEVNDDEGGVAPTGCGVSNNGDSTLHITCNSSSCGVLDIGATYDTNQETNVRAESPVFSTVGFSKMNLSFEFIANGDNFLDNASLWYKVGSSAWVILDASLKSNTCASGEGEWSTYKVALPAACNNNPVVQIGFNWTNNSDNIGTNPSVAINNLVIQDSSFLPTSTAVRSLVSTVTINQPQFLLVSSLDSILGTTCVGANNGFVDLAVSGGTMPYKFNWSNGAAKQTIANIAEGSYTVTITDANGCTTLDTAVVPSLGAMTLTVDSTINPLCNSDMTGSIFITAMGDTSISSCSSPVVRLNEFLYRPLASMNNGTNPNAGEFVELIGPPGADISCYILTDGDWTITIPSGTIIPNDGLFTIGNDIVWGAGTFDLDAENCNCFNDGTGGYGLLILTDKGESISIFDAAGTFVDGVVYGSPTTANQPFSTTINTVGLGSCVDSVTFPAASAYSTAPGGMQPNTTLVRAPDGSGNWEPQVGGSLNACNSLALGDPSNIFTYLWSNGDTTKDLSGVSAGTYTVVATNGYGCSDTTGFTLTEPTALMVLDTLTNIGCMGSTTGSINLTVSGGVTPYSFAWSNGDTTKDLNNLPAGTYCGTVTDNNGCTASLCATVVDYSLDIPVDTLSICFGDSVQLQINTTVGQIHWTPTGSLSNDSILNPWASPTVTTTYVVRSKGTCSASDSVVVVVESINIRLDSITNPTCFGDSSGSIVTTSNSANLDYLWNTGDTTATLTNIPAGTYTLVASNGGACTGTLNATLIDPPSLQLAAGGITNVSCRGGNNGAIAPVLVTGGTPNYTYLWSDTTGSTADSLQNLSAGLYSIIVTDQLGCEIMDTFSVDQPSASMNIGYTATPVSCTGTNDGSATAQPVNGTPAYTYLWGGGTGNQTTATATGLATGTYTVTVTDSLGCIATANGIFIPQNVAIDSSSASITAPDSLLDCDLSPSGTLAVVTDNNNYTYLWSNGDTGKQATGLAEGGYTVTVSNNQGCSLVLMDTIKAPFVPAIFPFIDQIGNPSSSGTADQVFTLGTGNDQTSQGVQYSWTVSDPNAVVVDPSVVSTSVSASASGSYNILLTATSNDASACQDTGSVTLIVESVFLGMPTAFTPNGDGINDLYRPIGLMAEDVVRFLIYNRWGQIIYEGSTLENDGWDGTFQGQEQPIDEYIFVLEYKIGNNDKKFRRGGFNLAR